MFTVTCNEPKTFQKFEDALKYANRIWEKNDKNEYVEITNNESGNVVVILNSEIS